MAEELSPWDDPEPEFRAVPTTNPKTKKPVEETVCTLCGALVVSRKIHKRWHRDLSWR